MVYCASACHASCGTSADTAADRCGHCQLNAKNLYISAVTRKLHLVFFFHDHLYFRHLYPVSFPHEEGVWERFFIKLIMPSVVPPFMGGLVSHNRDKLN